MKLEFSRQVFEKKAQISNLIKIRPVRAELFHADGKQQHTKTRRNKPHTFVTMKHRHMSETYRHMSATVPQVSVSKEQTDTCQS